MRFVILTAVNVEINIYTVLTPYNLVEGAGMATGYGLDAPGFDPQEG
jgi:hypothetical protein